MSDYIDFKVVGQVIGIGVLLGAGLPLVFSLGLRALSAGTGSTTTGTGSAGFALTKNPAALVLGLVLLVVVVAAVVFGVYTIINKS